MTHIALGLQLLLNELQQVLLIHRARQVDVRVHFANVVKITVRDILNDTCQQVICANHSDLPFDATSPCLD